MSNLRSARDSIMKREAAEPMLQPHLSGIQKSCLQGLAAWNELVFSVPHLRFPITPRTMASFINDHLVQQAKLELPAASALTEHFEDRGIFLITFNRMILLPLQKSD